MIAPSTFRTTSSRLRSVLTAAHRALLDVVFPIVCVSCGADGHWLCTRCVERITPVADRCVRCRAPSLHGVTCGDCQGHTPLAGLIAVGSYGDEILRESVHALKFEGVWDLKRPLGTLLARKTHSALGTTLPSFTVTPLPLHPRRERSRGSNQAALLATELGSALALPVQHLLARHRSTAPQTSIAASLPDIRQANITGAFVVATPLPIPTHVLLVDDVATTGATLEEATRVLYHHGARVIWGTVVCRG